MYIRLEKMCESFFEYSKVVELVSIVFEENNFDEVRSDIEIQHNNII